MNPQITKLASTLSLIGFLTACGGGGGGGGNADNGGEAPLQPAAPLASIQFPTPQSLTNQTSVIVRGTAQDPDGSTITGVFVNGIEVQSDDGFATWQVTVPVRLGTNTLTVETEDATGNIDPAAASVDIRGHTLPLISGANENAMSVDTANNRALMVDNNHDAILAFDLASGERTVLASPRGLDNFINLEPVGSGEALDFSSQLNFDSDAQRALVLEPLNSAFTLRGVVEVDLNTGERSVFYNPNQGSGPQIDRIRSFVFDRANNRLFILDGFSRNLRLMEVNLTNLERRVIRGFETVPSDALALNTDNQLLMTGEINQKTVLYSVNSSTGDRELISGMDTDNTLVGNGPEFENPASIKVDDNNRALMMDQVLKKIVLVNLDNGDRTILEGTGVDFIVPVGADFFGAQHAIVIDRDIESLIVADLISGDRSLLTNNAIGTGVRFNQPHTLADLGNYRALVTDSSSGRLFEVDLTNGNRELVLDNPGELNLQAMTLDKPNNRAFFINNTENDPKLVELNLSTKALRVISSAAIGSGPTLVAPEDIAFSPVSNRVFVIDSEARALLVIDITTGNRSIISDDSNSGPAFDFPLAFVINRSETTAFVGDEGALMAVNLATGDRTLVSGIDFTTGDQIGASGLFDITAMILDETNNRIFTGSEEAEFTIVDLTTGEQTEVPSDFSGLGFSTIKDLIIDTENQRAFVLDSSKRAIFALDLVTGSRVLVSWSDFNRF
ncbi:MAG: PQQ-binding-like beta-propeller repeat protein [Pseudomonadota bacterium]|nr:PQQ-binding-like beta-propeller repeat protein [Pseudomonadota bacterium]